MIKREFWEAVADVWAIKRAIVIPTIDVGDDVPPDDPELDFMTQGESEDIDDLLKDLIDDF